MSATTHRVTIRAYVRRRLLIGYVLLLAGVFIAAKWYPFLPEDGRVAKPAIAFLTFVPLFAAIAFLSLALRCPRCSGNLALTPASYVAFTKKRRFNFCPYCGISADERLSATHPPFRPVPRTLGLNSTILDQVRRRLWIGYGLVLLAVVIYLVAFPPGPGRDKYREPVDYLWYAPFVVAIVYLCLGVRCPRCKGTLMMSPAAYTRFSRKLRFRFCPYCGVSVDESP